MSKLLEVENLHTVFHTYAGTVQAVRGVSLSIEPGQVLGIVGESGCGKSVTMLSILGLLDEIGEVTKGNVTFDEKNLRDLSDKNLQHIRGNDIGMIFQDPMTSLNPAYRIGDQLTEHLRIHKKMDKKQAMAKARKILVEVGIPNPDQRLKQYPHEFSGGMRQRVMIAMALITEPKLLIADEPTTALDVTIQAQILEILKDLRKTHGTAIILITHDLGIVAEMCDSVCVMYGGKIVERAHVRDLYYTTRHPYTKGLLASVPNPHEVDGQKLTPIAGQPPDLINPPTGCPFAARCSYAMQMCTVSMPEVIRYENGAEVACFLHHRQVIEQKGRMI
ncbi:MAG: ABC transporter ATP-binding protein [Sphaerochaeta sp.]|nr:ABC transporter ATP-binding protein [Sphaerochaeta sp.]